jgi:D-alanyl-D-alanine carboxypeptidase/D-alanyl-D-alanine-endopeptidase (penicillin-binding protein 4)
LNTVSKLNAQLTLLNQIDGTHYTVRGRIPLGHNPVVKIFPIQDPVNFARACFIETLRKQGIRISAAQLKPQAFALPEKDEYATLKKLAVHKSAPFGEVLKVTLKVSHNLYASTLPCLLAAKNGKSSAEEGLREQGKILIGLGVDITKISFAGGAGGMIADNVTPRATVQLLQGLSKRKDWPQFKKWLPEMGVDGTLATAKTGTLVYTDEMNGRSFLRSKALAGAVTTKSGRELLFAMFVNDVPLPTGVNTSREGKILGKLCEIIHKEVK